MALTPLFAHAFGQRYELPIPLYLFVLGGAGIVFLSFLLVMQRKVAKAKIYKDADQLHIGSINIPWTTVSFVILADLILAGLTGSQEVAENILPTIFWVIVWVAIPLSCGLIGNWTENFNPYANIAKITDSSTLRKRLFGRSKALKWPTWLGWWPAAFLYFALACFELIFNRTAVKPLAIAIGLLIYFLVSAAAGLIFSKSWLERGEVFTVLFATWGRLGYFRFGGAGQQGFTGGLVAPFEASVSRIAFVLLLLVSVSFDGLLSTPLWNRIQQGLPDSFSVGTLAYGLFSVIIFLLIAVVIWEVFSLFSKAVSKAGGHNLGTTAALAGLLPSLLPISFGYLLAHYFEYLVVNLQLLFPLVGNPIGKDGWPIHLPYPFNDDYEIHPHALPSWFYWYLAVVVIVTVHIVAVVLAHRHLAAAAKNTVLARRSEYPWIAAMVLYTMLSLWLLAQPLVKEKGTSEDGYAKPQHSQLASGVNYPKFD